MFDSSNFTTDGTGLQGLFCAFPDFRNFSRYLPILKVHELITIYVSSQIGRIWPSPFLQLFSPFRLRACAKLNCPFCRKASYHRHSFRAAARVPPVSGLRPGRVPPCARRPRFPVIGCPAPRRPRFPPCAPGPVPSASGPPPPLWLALVRGCPVRVAARRPLRVGIDTKC